MPLITCSECGKQVSDKAAACPQCGAPISAPTAPAPSLFQAAGGSPMAVTAPQSGTSEVTFYTDQTGIRITNARAIIGARTYSMANLTTVTVGVTSPSYGGAIWTILIGAVIFLAGAGNSSGGAAIFGLLVLGGGIWWAKSLKPTYHVRIGSAGGESNALSSFDRKYIEGVAAALNEAIIKRG